MATAAGPHHTRLYFKQGVCLLVCDSTVAHPPLLTALILKRKRVRLGSVLCPIFQQATLSPAFRNSQLDWLRPAAGSYRGKDLPAFSMGMPEVNSCASIYSTSRRDFVPLRNSLLHFFKS